MKRAASLKNKFTIFILIALTLLYFEPSANAATYSFNTYTGTPGAVYSTTFWGQTFTIPNGYSGTISSISGIKLQTNQNSVASIGRVRIYSSPAKTTLLATALSDFTIPISPGYSSVYVFTANFDAFSVTEGSTYFFELELLQGNGNYFFHEVGGNTYAGGSSYQGGTIRTTHDLAFTVNIDYVIPPNTVTLSLTSGSNLATYRSISQLKAEIVAAGTVSFYANGKIIPGCRKVLAVSKIAYCDWRPSVHGAVKLSAITYPTDTANYSTASTTNQLIGVATRGGNR
jgi:hypothetical protein